MSDDDLGAAVPLDGDRLDALERLAEKATPGAWAVLDLADAVFDSEDNRGWWWVWRAGCEHYAGILEVQSTYKASAEKTLVGCSIGEAQITDATRGDVERADAEFIAAADPSTVLALVAALRASWAEVERLTGELQRESGAVYEYVRSLRSVAAERDEARAALATLGKAHQEQADRADAAQRTLAEINNVAHEHAKGGYTSYHRGARVAALDVLAAASRTGAADKENDR